MERWDVLKFCDLGSNKGGQCRAKEWRDSVRAKSDGVEVRPGDGEG